MQLGVNLSFTVKRLPEAREWARFVRETLNLDLVQFTFDLLDPWTPADLRKTLAQSHRQAAQEYGITIHSAFTGLAAYTYNNLLHPDEAGRAAALLWWRNAIETAAELGCEAVGGQLGALSVADAANPSVSERRFQEAFEAWVALSQYAHEMGLTSMYIEPTPLTREFPYNIEQAEAMMVNWRGRTALPVKYAFDIGHAGYKPLYGNEAVLESWLETLGEDIGLIHIQNTDGMSDSHWGWPDERGTFDVAEFGMLLQKYGLEDRPVFIEVFYPFELADESVLNNIHTSVEHCREALTVV
jgi:D-erythrulose 1-phosphate 3-epimerase